MSGSGWDFNFWKAGKPKAMVGSQTLASTTDTQESLNRAAKGEVDPPAKPSFIYTEVGPSLRTADGAVEHGEPFVVTDLPEPEPNVSEFMDATSQMTPEQKAAAKTVYRSQANAARALYPDFDEVLESSDQLLQQSTLDYIEMLLANGSLVGYYLGKHPAEVEKLRNMPLAKAQRHAEQISFKLATDQAFGMDTDEFRTYRAKRTEQIRRRYSR